MLELDEIEREIFKQYKPALRAIGVDLGREDVLEALRFCYEGLETAIQAFIEWWFRKKGNIDYPTAGFVTAINEKWKPIQWSDDYLSYSEFIPPYQKWWEEAGEVWGKDFQNYTIADVGEDNHGFEYIQLITGDIFSLDYAERLGFLEFQEIVNLKIRQYQQHQVSLDENRIRVSEIKLKILSDFL
jgi:hypothetical protein